VFALTGFFVGGWRQSRQPPTKKQCLGAAQDVTPTWALPASLDMRDIFKYLEYQDTYRIP
ncbi:hypothetical protein K2Z83_05080, partial [Oscillochloris sp. ZM17-4]|uniref:hypothetical protein n=1 Tax=Oscillochloris sp. ZM17-4 TaxID=2866714 RepID=UPI001C731CBE